MKQIEIDTLKKSIKKFEDKIENLYDDYNERLITKDKYLTKKAGFESTMAKSVEQLNKFIADVQHLEDLKKKPIRDSYSKETFLREIRNVIKQVIISDIKPTTTNGIKRVFGLKDVPVLITIESATGEKFKYVLSRYTDKIMYFGKGNTKMNTRLRPEPFKNAYEMGYVFEQAVHKLIVNKSKKAA